MELVLALSLLYLWQCTVRVPRGARLFVKPIAHWYELVGEGRRLAHPLPSALCVMSIPPGEADASAFDSARLDEALERARAATGWLAGFCDAYAVLLFAGLPILIGVLTEEVGLLYGLAAIAAVHVVALGLLYRADRFLRPERSAERFESLLTAALYPPALLRAPQELVRDATSGFHPAVVCSALMPRSVFVSRLRQMLASLDTPRGAAREGLLSPAQEKRRLVALARERGLTPRELRLPRSRDDVSAASYCEACLSDFRPGFDRCVVCGVPTRPYEGEAG